MPDRGTRSVRAALGRIFDDDATPTLAGRIVNHALAALIIINVAGVILESVEPIHRAHPQFFDRLEQAATFVFAVEYLLRVWTIVEVQNPRFRHPLWGRLRYLRTFFALVDLTAVLPAILGLLGAADFRVLRLLRLSRMLKLTRHSTVFNLLWAVFREEARSILAVLFVVGISLTMSAAIMYLVEGDAQPEAFKSIPACMWWAIETITTVGYGDMVPITPAGRVVGAIVSIVGIGTLALFTGLITISFMDQLRIRRLQYRRMIKAQLAAGPLGPEERDAIERQGARMGLGEREAVGLVEEVGRHPSGICPNCGHRLSMAAETAAAAAAKDPASD